MTKPDQPTTQPNNNTSPKADSTATGTNGANKAQQTSSSSSSGAKKQQQQSQQPPKQEQQQQNQKSAAATASSSASANKSSGGDSGPKSPTKKKKAEYVPPSPITVESPKPNRRSSSNESGSGDESVDILGALGPENTKSSSKNKGASSANSEYEEEFHGELTLYNNIDLDNAISVITTDPDLQSEIPVHLSPKKNKKANQIKGAMTSEGLAKPYTYEYSENPPEPSSLSGMRFDELYRLKGVLGTGAFSTVREGFHRSNSDVSYAVKCINRKKLSEEDEAALLDEVSILKEMKHPHIIRLFDFFTEASTYYLVMERMRGGELFDRIVAKAYYNEKEARDTCRIILRAVEHMHSHHVAHRDLKPENLLLLSDIDDSAVKIADFGFAKKVYEKSSLTTQCGTPGYVAPEILEGTAYDERADMWSVGVILYILLGGYPPFIESTQRDLFRKIRKGEYEFHEEYWGTVSQDAKTLISSLLTVSADDRLTAEGALDNEWILGDDMKLAARDLGSNLDKLRNFNAKRKFRAAVSTVMAVNKLSIVSKEFFSQFQRNDSTDFDKMLADDPEDDSNPGNVLSSASYHVKKTNLNYKI